MVDAKRPEAVNGKLLQGSRPSVVVPDLSSPTDRRSEGRKKQQEPVCPINVTGPELGEIINDWLTFVRREVDEQHNHKASDVTRGNQYGQSHEDMDGVLVCIYDRQCRSCTNHNRPGTGSCSQRAPSDHELGTNIGHLGLNCYGPSSSCNEPRNRYSDHSAIYTSSNQFNTSCNQRHASCKQRNTSCKQTNTGFKQTNTGFKQTNTGSKQPYKIFDQSNKGFKQPNTGFDNQIQVLNNMQRQASATKYSL